MIIVDCRGLACPEPVLKTKTALESKPGESLEVIVDNEIARENVLRFAHSQGRKTRLVIREDSTHITMETGELSTELAFKEKNPAERGTVLLITAEALGQGSDDLGRLLMRNFLYTLGQGDILPEALAFMNAGVKLAVAGSPVYEELTNLEGKGVLILVCGTCLDYYHLQGQSLAGRVSNMYDITDLLMGAEHLVSI